MVGEPLWIYLAATEGVISSILLQQEGEAQHLVYFISHFLKDAKSQYTPLEKLSYALIIIARHLRPYFLSYPILYSLIALCARC